MSELKKCPFCGGEAKHWLGSDNEKGVYCFDCKAGIEVYGTLEELYSAWNTRVDGWISVEDRLPEEGEMVLMFSKFKNYHMGWYDKKQCKFYSEGYSVKQGMVTHWRPLPEPPKGD